MFDRAVSLGPFLPLFSSGSGSGFEGNRARLKTSMNVSAEISISSSIMSVAYTHLLFSSRRGISLPSPQTAPSTRSTHSPHLIVRLWNAEKGETIERHCGAATSIVFSPDGRERRSPTRVPSLSICSKGYQTL